MVEQYVGKSYKRADALEKVTGTASFIDDLRFPRMVYMKVLRSNIAHGKILSLDTTEAESVDGVIKVISRNTEGIEKDMVYGTCIFDVKPMAFEKVHFYGEVVAAVIAESEKIASEAVKKIKIEYQELPFVVDPVESAKSEILVRDGKTFEHVPTFQPVEGTNIFFKYNLKKGNSIDPFKDADVVIEREFEYPLINHVALEPHGAVACWDTTGELHLWSSSQAPFVLREVLAHMFKMYMNKIHVNIPYLGGGFGGKSDYTIEPLLAFVSRYVPGYYVKFILTREEVFTGSVLGRGMKGTMKLGAKKDGTFVGLQAKQYYSDGAFGDTGCNVVLAGGHNCAGPYKFDNCDLYSYGVYTNTPPVGAFRGYGHPEGQLMMNRMIQILSNEIGIDVNEIHRKNFLKPGDTNSLGNVISEENGNIFECFEKLNSALEAKELPKEDEEYYYGRGVACLVKSPVQTANASSCVFLKFNEDLTVNISMSGVEMGQGALTVLAQIAAETLKIPPESIRINYEINTQLSPWEWQTVASMTTMRVGNAIIQACERAILKFKQNAAEVLKCGINELLYDGKVVYRKDDVIPLKQLVLGYQYEDGHTVGNPVLATGCSVVREVTYPDLETGQYRPYEWTFGAQGCDIKIQKSTGKINVLRFITVLDIGKVINPETAKGQVMGGVLQGIGAALMEKIKFNEKGIMTTTNLRKYPIPKLSDMPDYEVYFVENQQPNGPYGARPMAEHPIIGPPPSILNALQNATGISLTTIPATPEKVLDALKNGGQ